MTTQKKKKPQNPNEQTWGGFSLTKKRDVPKGLWQRCAQCEEMLFVKSVEENRSVCPLCGQHFRISARKRIAQLCDEGSFEEMLADYQPVDALNFTDSASYKKRLKAYQKKNRPIRCCRYGQSICQRSHGHVGSA